VTRESIAADIVEAGRRMYQLRLVVGLEGNLSARLPGGRFLCSPAGSCKGYLKPDELVEVDAAGRPLGPGKPSTEIAMHMAIYEERPELNAVAHGHPAHATAFAAAGRALDRCLLPEIIVGLGQVPVSDYGTPSTGEVAAALRPWIRQHDAVLLRNHGVVVAATTVMGALYTLESVEQLATIEWLSAAIGGGKALNSTQVEQLHSIRGVYGFQSEAPACTPDVEGVPQAGVPSEDELARTIAEEIAREFGDAS
jgi:L-fuculose-phosphate aldolase